MKIWRPGGPRREAGLLAIVLLACSLMLAGCGPKGPAGERLERLSIAFQTWVGYGPLYLAAEKGFFAEEGLELVFVAEELDAARRDAFKAGMLDAEAGTIDLLVNKRALGTPVVAVAEVDLSLGGDVIVATDRIQSLADLVGKRVAFARDDVGETFLSYLFHEADLSLDQITVVPMAPDEAGQAFLDGQVDAAVTWEPWVSRAAARAGAHVLLSSKDAPGIIVDILTVREQLVRENPQIVKKLVRGWYRAVDYYKAHPEEASQIIARYYRLSAEEYREHVAGLHWPDYEEAADHFASADKPGGLIEVFDTIALIKYSNGRIPRKPAASEALEPEILRTLYDTPEAQR